MNLLATLLQQAREDAAMGNLNIAIEALTDAGWNVVFGPDHVGIIEPGAIGTIHKRGCWTAVTGANGLDVTLATACAIAATEIANR